MYRIIRGDLFGKVTFEQRPEEVREIIGKSISKKISILRWGQGRYQNH